MKYIKGKPQKTEDIKLIEKALTCDYEKCSLKPETLELVKNEKFLDDKWGNS